MLFHFFYFIKGRIIEGPRNTEGRMSFISCHNNREEEMNMIDAQKNEEFLKGFANTSGPLPLGLKNDFVAHYVFLKSPIALKGLICAVMKLDPEHVKDVRVMNPIDYGEYVDKLIILDIKVDLDNREYFDIEIQVYLDSHWEKRSLLYLCRTFADGIGSGENYDKLKPATLITITDKELIPKGENEREFLEEHGILNIRTHMQYSSLLRIKILNLHNIDCATEEDAKSGLVFWAKLFSANTWEDIRMISKGSVK